MKEFTLALVGFISVILFADINTAVAQVTGAEEGAPDCKEYGVDYKQTEGLTKEEITDRMDKALFESLNKYEECLQQSQSDGAASGSAAGAAGAGTGGMGADASSTASSGIEGTEKSEAVENPNQDGNSPNDTAANANGKTLEQKQALKNGKLPDDIPPSDNDGILQQKVKEAALNEPNPEKRAKLWNEYRKLKGLPLKDQSQI